MLGYRAQLDRIEATLAMIERALNFILTKESKIMATLDDLTTDVASEETVSDSVLALLAGIAAQVAALKTTQTDPATATKIDALDATIKARSAKLAAAVTANTSA